MDQRVSNDGRRGERRGEIWKMCLAKGLTFLNRGSCGGCCFDDDDDDFVGEKEEEDAATAANVDGADGSFVLSLFSVLSMSSQRKSS